MGNWALWGCAFIIFAECGLFSILPGDSLLFTIGMFSAIGTVSLASAPAATLALVCLVMTVAAIAGNAAGYWLGRLIGPPLFRPREGFVGKLFNQKYVDRTSDFFDRHGSKALILARFVPIVRTFVTLVAGVARMNFRTFLGYSAIGGVLWAVGVTVLGYFLGSVSFIRTNIDLALMLIVLVSLVPMGIEYLLHRRRAGAPVETA